MRPNLRIVGERPLRAVLYLRQSKTREDSISIELQEASCREYAARMGYDVVDVLSDPGISGRTWDRPAVQRSLAMVEARDADVIVVWKWSRLARNRRDWAVAVDKIEGAGGRLESSTEAVDTTTSTGRFTRGMLAELAAFESDRIGDMWRETHTRRRKLGLPHSGSPRMGYAYDPESKTYSPDPETADIVRELYRRYIAGDGLQALSTWLRDIGVESPRSKTLWTHRGVASFMDGGFPAGYLRIHDPACPERHPSGKSCGRWAFVEGTHEALIDEATWEAYRAARAKRTVLPRRLVAPASAMSGLGVCDTCGQRMSLHRGQKTIHRIRCANRQCTGPAMIRYDAFEEAVLAWLPTVAQGVDEEADAAEGTNAAQSVERDRLRRQLDETERALQRLTVDLARGLVPASAYEGARDELDGERQALEAKLRAFERRTAMPAHAEAAALLLERWEEMPPAEVSSMLREIVVVRVTRRADDQPATATPRGTWETAST
ncbi:recombinase family protein [Cellulosimicrobium protaetiae]